MKLNNKIVLVTGASKGIGGATAIALAKEGCSLVINFKSDNESAQKVLDECNRHSKGNIIFRADVSNEKEVLEMCKKIKQQFSHLDIVVNNAGIFDENDNPTNIKSFENIFRNNHHPLFNSIFLAFINPHFLGHSHHSGLHKTPLSWQGRA